MQTIRTTAVWGGEVAITTSSKESGIIVLRHELGHNFGVVGEEYDGGGYFGANYGKSLASIPWGHWLTGTLRAEPSIARLVSWPWSNLKGKPFLAGFSSDGGWDKVSVRYSVSGIETERDLSLTLDGAKLPFSSPGHSDRVFRLMEFNSGFSKGNHALVFTEGVNDGNNVVSSVVIHEYKSDYHFSQSYIGAYPLFSETNGELGYRPTHDSCLMRNMSSDHFCSVCQENNWLKFFGKVTPIDSVKTSRTGKVVKISVATPALGKWRPTPVLGESLRINWFRNGVVQAKLADSNVIEITQSETKNRWEVEVAFSTLEVRKDPRSLLKARKTVAF